LKQIINPYIRFRRKAQGRYANNLGGGYGRAISQDETECFFVVDAVMGESASNVLTICFNKDAETACYGGWTFKKNGVAFTNVSPATINQPCVLWFCSDGSENTSAGPQDVITADYVPGTCGELGDSECLLGELTDYPIENNIFGPIIARVGDSADNVIVLRYGVDALTSGDGWSATVGGLTATITNAAVVDGNVHLTLSADVLAGQVVEVSHGSGDVRATSIDGRTEYWYYDLPVTNSVGADFRLLANGDFRLLGAGTDARILV